MDPTIRVENSKIFSRSVREKLKICAVEFAEFSFYARVPSPAKVNTICLETTFILNRYYQDRQALADSTSDFMRLTGAAVGSNPSLDFTPESSSLILNTKTA